MRDTPTPFGWVIRVLASFFLLGYLTFGLLAAFVLGFFPGETPLEITIFILLALVFLLGFYFLWSNREGLAGLLFMLWYAALWPCEMLMTSDHFRDLPAPGTYMLVVGVMALIYWYGKKKNKTKASN
jgi:hypothetical protein